MSLANRRDWLSSGLEAGHRALTARERLRDRMFPNLPLVTHEGREVRFYDDLIKDKIVLLNMMYARCDGICMPTTLNLVKVQHILRERYGDRFGREIVMYSLTLKPWEDSPAALNSYVKRHGVGPGWTFLTGKPDDLERLRRSLGYVDLDPELDRRRISHTGNVRYGNEARTIWAACPGRSKPSAVADAISWVDWPKNGPAASAKGEGK